MASYRNTSLALFLLLNLLPFSLAVNSWTPSEQKSSPSCPIDTLKFGVCTDLLGSLLNITLGRPPITPCCSLIDGLVDLEAAVCVCTALKANILGININIPLSLSLLLNVCSKKVPQGYLCS